MDDVYDNIDDYSPKRKRKIFFVFEDMIADVMSIKIFQTIIRNRIRIRNIFYM